VHLRITSCGELTASPDYTKHISDIVHVLSWFSNDCIVDGSCLELVSTLGGVQTWLNETLEQIRHQQTLGGDLVSLQLQYEQLEVVSVH